jgi:23S rRNA (guanosine2251-2'-O)-methyltransferase
MRRHSSRPPTPSTSESTAIVFGANPVLEALAAAPESIRAVVIDARSEAGARAAERARALGIAVETADRNALDRLTGGGHHQGVAARTRPFAYAAFEDVLTRAAPLLVALDGVTDPQNLGSILRSAEVLGAGGVILPRDRAAAVTPAVIRAASGASAHLPVAQVVNLVRALEDAKRQGYWIVGLDVEGTSRFQQLPALERALLVVGGEGHGIRPLVRRGCDFSVAIPMRGRVASLNAAVATAIGLYALRERLQADGSQGSDY